MTDSLTQRFGFTEWPFRVVADQRFAHVWADRTVLRKEIDRRLNRLSMLGHSTIQLLWADFGAGKTHALRYIEAATRSPSSSLTAAYSEVPVGIDSLVDLYQRFVQSLAPTHLVRLANHVALHGSTLTTSGAVDFAQAMRLLAGHDANGNSMARSWFGAQKGYPAVRDLRVYGIGQRIETDERAIEVMAALCAAHQSLAAGGAQIWLLDEFQRVAAIAPKKRDALGRNLVSLYNACSVGLHIVISSSVAQQSTALGLLPPDLQSRANTFPILALGHLSEADCEIFCTDLFSAYRFGDHPPEYPFDQAGLRAFLASACNATQSPATPRHLMQRLETIMLDAADRIGEIRLPFSAKTVEQLLAAGPTH